MEVVAPKKNGVDYFAHVSAWSVTSPDGVTHEVINLKKWCRENDLNYYTIIGSKKGWSCIKR